MFFFLNRPPNRPSPLLRSIALPPRENPNRHLLGFRILSSNMKNVEGVGNLSNWSTDICCLCCPTTEFCGCDPSAGKKELMVDGFPRKSRRWNNLSISFVTSSGKSPCTILYWVSACSTLVPRVKHSLIKCRWRIDYTWAAKNVSWCTELIPFIRSQTLVAALHTTKTWNNCRLTGNVG